MAGKLAPSLERQIEQGVAVLKRGGVIAYPTDTVYGLGAGVSFSMGIARIYEIKERPRSMPLPLLIADVSQLRDLAESVSPIARLLMQAFWPGSLTLVLHAAASVPNIVTAGGKTVALRIPDHPVPLALIRGLGTAIVGTSANLSGRPSAMTAEEVVSQLGARVDHIIDGGRCPGGVESTIMDVTGPVPVMLRAGSIPGEEIERVCGGLSLKDPS